MGKKIDLRQKQISNTNFGAEIEDQRGPYVVQTTNKQTNQPHHQEWMQMCIAKL